MYGYQIISCHSISHFSTPNHPRIPKVSSQLQGLDCAIEQDLHGVARRLKAANAAAATAGQVVEVTPLHLRSIDVDWGWLKATIVYLLTASHRGLLPFASIIFAAITISTIIWAPSVLSEEQGLFPTLNPLERSHFIQSDESVAV